MRLASFCRLCLAKTSNKVPVFSEGDALLNLMTIIEVEIDAKKEPDAVVCFDCIVTLEGFYQFKEQCQLNDKFVKTIPPKGNSPAPGEGDDDVMESDHPVENDELESDESAVDIEELEESEQEDMPKKSKRLELKRKLKAKTVKAKGKTPAKKQTIKKQNVSSNKKNDKKANAISPRELKWQNLSYSAGPKKIKTYDDKKETLELAKIEEECAATKVPRRSVVGPTLEDLQVLADSYPDFFYFEKRPRSVYFTMVYYGERFHGPIFTDRYTYWQCKHRRKYCCSAQVCVTNDYKTFERRYEHTHGDLPEKDGLIFTPLEALPELFKACRKVVLQKRVRRRQKLLEKYKSLNESDEMRLETDEETDIRVDEINVDEVNVDEDNAEYVKVDNVEIDYVEIDEVNVCDPEENNANDDYVDGDEVEDGYIEEDYIDENCPEDDNN